MDNISTAVEFLNADSQSAQTDRVVAECRTELETADLSIAQAARQMGKGVSQATLSTWLANKYTGDSNAVTGRVERWLETRREAIRRSPRDAGLDRHVDLGITEDIHAALAHAQAAGDVVLIHGPSGAGKTVALRRYAQTRTAAYVVTATAAIATVAGLLSRVALAVDAGDRHPSAAAAEASIIARLINRSALLMVDESHHLPPRLLDELRCIRDVSGCGLALAGANELWTSLAGSRRCDQIVGRIAFRLALQSPGESDVVELVSSVLKRAPRAAEIKAAVATGYGAGGLHALRRLLLRAWMIARADGREAITPADVKLAGHG